MKLSVKPQANFILFCVNISTIFFKLLIFSALHENLSFLCFVDLSQFSAQSTWDVKAGRSTKETELSADMENDNKNKELISRHIFFSYLIKHLENFVKHQCGKRCLSEPMVQQ